VPVGLGLAAPDGVAVSPLHMIGLNWIELN